MLEVLLAAVCLLILNEVNICFATGRNVEYVDSGESKAR